MGKNARLFLRLLGSVLLLTPLIHASDSKPPEEKSKSRKIIKYRKYTEVDLTGSVVQGKIRSPEVFYIFQRQRSQTGSWVRPPDRLDYQNSETIDVLRKVMRK